MRVLVPFLIVIPAIEIGLLLLAGNTIGVLPTILLIIATGVAGAYLAKQQGFKMLQQLREEVAYGGMPNEAILDGVCILAGGLLLLTPGFVTDLTGFLLLLPPSRISIKKMLRRMIKRWMDKGNIIIMK
ncbi:FxsA family protein [Bacillus fonticola]|uniref:FxsA family protein n=1 Tax=Bacillus fonticola TaxID=2728853 RepID=UPI00147517CF|nr:FxsA family protein [Bacillus fonticola]